MAASSTSLSLVATVPVIVVFSTALLLSGVAEHVVSRRLGHTDIQTTQNLYGWVSEEAEQRTVAEWKALTERWRTEP